MPKFCYLLFLTVGCFVFICCLFVGIGFCVLVLLLLFLVCFLLLYFVFICLFVCFVLLFVYFDLFFVFACVFALFCFVLGAMRRKIIIMKVGKGGRLSHYDLARS